MLFDYQKSNYIKICDALKVRLYADDFRIGQKKNSGPGLNTATITKVIVLTEYSSLVLTVPCPA